MFEGVSSVEELNKERVEALRRGVTPLEANKAYAKRKAEIMSGQARPFKRLVFESPEPAESGVIIALHGVSFDEYTLYIE